MGRHQGRGYPKHLTPIDSTPKPRHRVKTILALFTLVVFLFLMFGGFLQILIR